MTHSEIKDKDLRDILARELLAFRRLRKRDNINLKDDYFFGAKVGFVTALHRVQLARNSRPDCPFCQVRAIAQHAMDELESIPDFDVELYDDAVGDAFNKMDDTQSLFMCYCKEGQP